MNTVIESQNGHAAAETFENGARDLTVAIHYKPFKLYYIDITPETFIKHSSPNLGRLMHVYIGNCTRVNRQLRQCTASVTEVPMSYAYAMSAN